MFDPKHLSELINHVHCIVEKQGSYIIGYDLSQPELIELSKHFDVERSGEFANLPSYKFTKKCQN
jgi:hypothetical protein